ncbi:MAG: SdpI family protein [Blautia sp.]
MKKTSKEFIISTIICVLPLIFGLLVYKKLPQEIPTKWYSDGTVGQYMPKEFTVFGMPLFFILMNALVHFAMNTDPKRQNIGSMMRTLGKWIIPVLSVVTVPMALLWGMGYQIPISRILPILLGILFVVIGNYFPKTRRSYTTGIKTPWTLNSDENWRRTHHVAALLWIAAGIAMIAMAFLPQNIVQLVIVGMIIVLIVVPYAYSYTLYRKGI